MRSWKRLDVKQYDVRGATNHATSNSVGQPNAGQGNVSHGMPRVDEGTIPTNLPVSLSEATRQFQVAHIDKAIDECNGNMTDAAARLGLHRSNLYRKMRQLGMQTSGE